MFEFAAGHVQQEERERRITEGLRRRELLAAPATGERHTIEQGRTTPVHSRAHAGVPVHAER